MENIIGTRVAESRQTLGLTQDQFGARYGVSGPAVFKFEKGYVKPSLDLWLKMARDCDIAEKKAVLLWIKAKLPPQYRTFIDLSMRKVADSQRAGATQSMPAYADIRDGQELRRQMASDLALPKGLRSLSVDDEFWSLYRPTGQEIQLMIEKFGDYADAGQSLFLQAFRLIRECAQTG